MLHFTYIQNGSGRMGHKLMDILAVFNFAFYMNGEVIYDKSWQKNYTVFIPEKSIRKYTGKELENYDYIYEVKDFANVKDPKYNTYWKGISFEDFSRIVNNIRELQKTHENMLVRLYSICRVKFDNIYNWYREGKINEDIYHTKLIPMLRNIYFDGRDDRTRNAIAIHVRRGDFSQQSIKAGFTYEYFVNMIRTLNETLKLPIEVYCESINCIDILPLEDEKNTTLCLGDEEDIEDHFHKLCTAKILIIGPTSFGFCAGFINRGLVLIDEQIRRLLPNYLNFCEMPKNFFLFDTKLTNKLLEGLSI